MITTNLSQYILSSVLTGHSVCPQQVTMLVVSLQQVTKLVGSLQQVTMLSLVLVLQVVTVTACKGGGSEPAVVRSSEDQTGDRHFYLIPSWRRGETKNVVQRLSKSCFDIFSPLF